MSMRMPLHLTLSQKIILPLLAGWILLQILLTIWLLKDFNHSLHERVRMQGELVTNAINYAADSVSSIAELQRLVDQLGSEPEISMIMVVAGEPQRIYAGTRHEWNHELVTNVDDAEIIKDTQEISRDKKSIMHFYIDKNIAEIGMPLLKRNRNMEGDVLLHGAILVHMDTTALRAEQLRRTWEMAGTMILATILGALLVWWLLHHYVLRGTHAIALAIAERNNGNRTARAETFGDDELTWLALTLNAMFDELEEEESERNHAELLLRQQALMQQAILASAGAAIIATDTDGIIQLFNPHAEQMLGYRAEELQGKYQPGIFHDATEVKTRAEQLTVELGTPVAADFNVFVLKCLLLKTPETHEWTYIRKDGTRIPVLLTVSIIWGDNGEAIGCLGVAHDISANKHAEQQLREAKQTAESASQTKSEFLAMMSHEIRTPLNGVIGMAQVLARGELTDKQRKQVETIHRSGNALLEILNDILDFSKIEAGRLELELRAFNLENELADVVQLMRGAAKTKQLDVQYHYQPDCPQQVIGDSTRLRQIVMNLLGNAIKFTSSGQVVLTVAGREENGLAHLHIGVQDTGIGIAPEKMSRLFQPFSQADSTTTRHYGGSGLGLVICRRLVDMMQGSIHVDSAEGRGSHFWMELQLPLAEIHVLYDDVPTMTLRREDDAPRPLA